ncbi:ATP phosphoribosyltransferase [Saccharibacter sp. 17.LH.SD]|uniref:ATP phosphoribosyltransferase n=1 Tax=Saccharibacter sp. 17.LH.SD TaxID=2689393 RepID=UPI00136EA7C7|nr:ATP phosphoribosyltransferase [Saccharibacter sp. 17.LH.SD]MXV45217.1 ATP phosphoribosyltransferase [Saccharibacter sp. 17.LH.SD]
MTNPESPPLILALPKGRILKALRPVLERTGLEPAPDCLDESSRRLRFPTSDPSLDVVRVRSFDVATFAAYGGADIGVCGADVLMEFDYSDLYAPLDLGIGACRIAVARPKNAGDVLPEGRSRLRVATKYPAIARRHFASRAVNAEIVHLHGAMELAPALDMADVIVDLVDTGSTLRANGLEEVETIAHVTSRLIVNRVALKTRPEEIGSLIERFRAALAVAA